MHFDDMNTEQILRQSFWVSLFAALVFFGLYIHAVFTDRACECSDGCVLMMDGERVPVMRE